MPLSNGAASAQAAVTNAHLNYYGGRVLSNVRVVQVLYGAGGYLPQISGDAMGAFYAGVTNSPHMDWLNEYNTNITTAGGLTGSDQAIGRGTFLSRVSIQPAAANNGTTISDSQIQAELDAEITSGVLPAPDANTIYMVNFPQGKVVTEGGNNSCQAGGFCAYHGTFTRAGSNLFYGVLPDMQAGSGCDLGCGHAANGFDNQTLVASHELIEAVTDSEVGLATTFAPPLAWYDSLHGEIGDICNALQGSVVGGDGQTYTVQKEWSNLSNACIVSRPQGVDDFAVILSPSSVTVANGTSVTLTVATTVTSGLAQPVALSVSGLPTGVTATFNPTTVTASGSAALTLTATPSAPATSGTFSVTGTGTARTNSAVGMMTVAPSAPQAGIINGGFETGDFTGWSVTAYASIIEPGYSGKVAAKVGSGNETNGDSSISQTFTASPDTIGLTFFYNIYCPDSLTFDWATATLRDNTTGTTSTVVPKSCSNSGGWRQATTSLTRGHSYTLTLTSHDDNHLGDATSVLYDEVTLITAPPPPVGVVNGGFEAGDLSGWTLTGAASMGGPAHSGAFSAKVGSVMPTRGDSSLAQTFTAPAGTTSLSFYYNLHCPDTLNFDWGTASLQDNTTGAATLIIAKTCSLADGWQQALTPVTEGHNYTLTLTSHDDNYASDPTYVLFDDVTLGTATPPPSEIINGDFETGTLSGWNATGAAGVITPGHGGTYAARVGDTSPTDGDSALSQTFVAPSGVSTLSFFYEVFCPDTVTYDWATASLRDNDTGTTTPVLARSCPATATWTNVTAAVTSGHSYTLTLTNHDDNLSADPTYTLYDDITLR